MTFNPFCYGPPVPPNSFIGRRHILEHVISRILSFGQSTALTGEPRLGKTSLLRYLKAPQKQVELFGEAAERLLFCFLDGQRLPDNCTITQFWRPVLNTLKEKWVDPMPNSALAQYFYQSVRADYNASTLEILFEQLYIDGRQLVLLIDEFDRLVDHPLLSSTEFFGSLRSLSSLSQGSLTLVIASRLSLTRLNAKTKRYNPNSSPFFNIFSELPLGPLELDESNILLAVAGERFNQVDRTFIQDLAGGHPFLLQAAAAAMWDAYTKDLSTFDARCHYVLNRLRQSEAHHFADTWDTWEPTARQAFTTVALLSTKADALPTFVINLVSFHERLPELLPELKNLELVGVIRRNSETINGWQVAQGILLTWLWDQLIQEIRDETTLGLWLRGIDLERPWTDSQRQQFWDLLTQVRQAYPNTSITFINTGGGLYIGGNVQAGGDFIGRDQTTQA